MKKILTTLIAIVLTSSIAVNAAESKVQHWVNHWMSPITKKERAYNEKQAEAQKAHKKRQADLKKQQHERQKAYEKRKKDREKAYKKQQKEREKALREAQKRRDDRNKAIRDEANFWRSLFDRK